MLKGYCSTMLVRFEFRGLGKAQAIGQYTRIHKSMWLDEDDTIVGASVVGPHATDLLTELSLSCRFGVNC